MDIHALPSGFTDPVAALENIHLMAEGVDKAPASRALKSIVRACSNSADPDACLNNFERVSASFKSRAGFLTLLSARPDSVKILAPLLAASAFLTRHITASPEERLARLLAPGYLDAPREREELTAEAVRLCPPGTSLTGAMSALRRFKYDEFLRITARDLMGPANLSETTLELSNLADAALEAALGVAMRELDRRYGAPPCPFTVIAMGKLGGQELNYSSDIDVMFLYLTDKGATSGPAVITNHQYFVKLAELVTRIIAERTEDGFVFRVDTRLRPEGAQGDLAQCLAGYEIYYESWGQTWERSALIKARPSAGDMELGRAFMEMIRPFVYRKHLDYSAITEIRDMKQRVESFSLKRLRTGTDLKLGAGGIREIEFFISALQLIYGGREAGIRERGSLKALHRLALKGLITSLEQQELSRAYEFLRNAEHRLQVVEERQTHSFASEKAEVRALAMRMGFRDGDGAAEGAFGSELARHMRRVREIFDGLLSEQAVPSVRTGEEFEALLSSDTSDEEAEAVLADRGFRRPRQAYRNVTSLRDGSAGFTVTPRGRTLFARIMPALLAGCAASPDPDMAVNNLESFVNSFGSREALYTMMTERPETASRITRLFGASEYFARLIISHPEMGDALLLTGPETVHKTEARMMDELAEALAVGESFASNMDALRRFKRAEELRIGMGDIFANPGCRAVSRELAALAGAILKHALSMSIDDLRKKYGYPRGLKGGSGIAVIGFGKLGAWQLGYGSDLDIIFLYEKAGPTDGERRIGCAEFFARLSERVIFALSSLTKEGFAYRVDTRLRPGGTRGVLAHTVQSLERYYLRSASVWELQALTRARAVAGDEGVSAAFEAMHAKILAAPREAAGLSKSISAMRTRLERERGGRSGYNIKYGQGGLVDVEFAVQYLQLLHGRAKPEILVPDTYDALSRAVRLGLVGKGGRGLIKSYKFLKELESRLRITTSQPETVLPEERWTLSVLAARMGYAEKGDEAARALLADYARHTKVVREMFDRILGRSIGPTRRSAPTKL